MKDYLRLPFPEYLSEGIPVSDITDDRFDVEIEQRKMAGLGRRRQGITGDLGAQPSKPQHQPGAFETGVAGDEHFLVSINVTEHRLSIFYSQIFQPAWPDFQSCSSTSLSRRASIHFQNP